MSHTNSVIDFSGSFIEPPSVEDAISASQRLQSVGALDKKFNLTALGHHLAALPVDVRIGKLMLYGAIFGCVDAALTMAACLSYKNPFVSPFGKRDEANKKKMSFAAGFSDQITVLMAYKVCFSLVFFVYSSIWMFFKEILDHEPKKCYSRPKFC